MAIKGKFDAVLDTIGVSETERIGINFLKRGGHYMTLQVGYESLSPFSSLSYLQMYSVHWQNDLCLLFH